MIARPSMLRCVVAEPGQTPEFRSLTDDEIAQARRDGKIVLIDPDDDIAPAAPLARDDDASKWFRLNSRIRGRHR